MKTILIADDEPDILKLVKYRLQKAGYLVVTAVDGKDALAKVDESRPDLVLLDFSMPFMNGDQVCKTLRANMATERIPIILMTASSHKVIGEHIKEIGANDCILKPFESQDILEKIHKWLKES